MRNPARKASPTPVGSALRTSRATGTEMTSSPLRWMVTPSLPRVMTRTSTRRVISSADQPVFCSVRCASYSFVKRYAAPSTRRRISGPSANASCWDGSAMKGMPAGPALLGVPEHGLGVVRADEDEVEPADALGDRAQLDEPRVGHRAGVERRDLGHVVVGRADEPRRVPRVADVDRLAVHPVALQPGPVVGEVLAHRAHEDRPLAEVRHAERDVGRHAAAPDLQLVREEGERDLVELLDDERVAEAAPEGHEMVGRNGPGDRDLHGRQPTPDMHVGVTSRPGTPADVTPTGAGVSRDQLKLSPQAHELPALGLSIVKPCFSMVSAKSIVAPRR